jgi:hypothetical protein
MAAFEYRQAQEIRLHLIRCLAMVHRGLALSVVAFALALILGGCQKTPPGDLLRQAASTGTSADVDRILNQNAVDVDDPDPKAGMTALEWAVIAGNQDIATTLLTDGADPNRYDNLGDNPVFHAIRKDNWPMLKLLLDHGGQIKNARFMNDQRVTPLMIAVIQNEKSMVDHLLALGADPTERDGDGLTAADHARLDGDKELVDLLESRATTMPAIHGK